MHDVKLDVTVPQDDRIMAYLRGEMTAGEEAAFWEDVQRDQALRESAVSVARIAKGMKHMGGLMDDEVKRALLATSPSSLVALLERIDGTAYMRYAAGEASCSIVEDEASYAPSASLGIPAKPSSRRGLARGLAYAVSAAASVVFLVFGGLKWKSYHDTTRLGAQYAGTFDASSLPARGGDNARVEQELKQLFSNVVDKKDYGSTIKRLTILWELSAMDIYNDYTDFSQEIGWHLAIAYLKDNEREQARVVLERLLSATEADGPFCLKVKELLEKVNGL